LRSIPKGYKTHKRRSIRFHYCTDCGRNFGRASAERGVHDIHREACHHTLLECPKHDAARTIAQTDNGGDPRPPWGNKAILKFVRGAFFGHYYIGPDGEGEGEQEEATGDPPGFFEGEDEDQAENDRFYGRDADAG
jgi:hypothetical protein